MPRKVPMQILLVRLRRWHHSNERPPFRFMLFQSVTISPTRITDIDKLFSFHPSTDEIHERASFDGLRQTIPRHFAQPPLFVIFYTRRFTGTSRGSMPTG